MESSCIEEFRSEKTKSFGYEEEGECGGAGVAVTGGDCWGCRSLLPLV